MLRLDRQVSVGHLIGIAAALRSEDKENDEYDRALVELIVDASGLSMDDRDQVSKAIDAIVQARMERLAVAVKVRGPLEAVKARLVALLAVNTRRINGYVKDGGEEHLYLDGKEYAYREAIDVVNEAVLAEKTQKGAQS